MSRREIQKAIQAKCAGWTDDSHISHMWFRSELGGIALFQLGGTAIFIPNEKKNLTILIVFCLTDFSFRTLVKFDDISLLFALFSCPKGTLSLLFLRSHNLHPMFSENTSNNLFRTYLWNFIVQQRRYQNLNERTTWEQLDWVSLKLINKSWIFKMMKFCSAFHTFTMINSHLIQTVI